MEVDEHLSKSTLKPGVHHAKGKRSPDAFFRDMLDHRERTLKWREDERERNELAQSMLLLPCERLRSNRTSPQQLSARQALEGKIHERLHSACIKQGRKGSRSPGSASLPHSVTRNLDEDRSKKRRGGQSVHEALFQESFRRREAMAARERERKERELEPRSDEIFTESSAFVLKERIIRETS